MKILISTILSLTTFIFSGCGTTASGPFLVKQYHLNSDKKEIVIPMGSYDADMSKVSPAQNLAIIIKKSAKVLKEKNINYFTIDALNKVPPMITNFSDLVQYCYPENKGTNANSWTAGSTSLEDKCELKIYKSTTNNDVWIKVIESEKNLQVGTWSVQEVLNDKTLNAYIQSAKLTAKNQDIAFTNIPAKTHVNLKTMRDKKAKLINDTKVIDNLN